VSSRSLLSALPIVPRRPRLPALAGVRIFAALHIYFFHLKQAHDAGLLRFPIFSQLVSPLANLIGRGYVSTGFFFQLSGFLLGYVYLKAAGSAQVSAPAFWKSRFVRLYPLYFVSLLLLVPAPALLPITAKNPSGVEIALGVLTNLTLTQAWFPAFAIWWNAQAWALSAFAAFYAVFPCFGRLISGMGERGLLRLVIALAVLSWLPAVAYILFDPAGDAWTATSVTLGGFWLNVLRFNPLTWIAQFLAGVALGRLFGLRVDRGGLTTDGRSWASAGDLLALVIVSVLAFVPWIPYVPLRHGILTSFTLLLIADFGRGHGVLARLLSWRGFQKMSEASFSLFALQMPAGLWFCIATLRTPNATSAHLLGMVAWTIGLAVLWAKGIQRPLDEWLRKRRTSHSIEPAGERSARAPRSHLGRLNFPVMNPTTIKEPAPGLDTDAPGAA
jgi:peptidoglycan/LPS O-acetylase OafA/YrhL